MVDDMTTPSGREADLSLSDDVADLPPVRQGQSRFLRSAMWMGGFALSTALCAVFGYYSMFSNSLEDDEGYMLIALRAFTHHGGLYTHVYSQYGPFYFEAWSTIFTWVPVTLDSGRVATLVVWMLTSLCFGIAIKMLTGNTLFGMATQVGSAMLLASLAPESMHPEGLAVLLLATMFMALALIAGNRRAVGYVVLGATLSALILTEVNVGAFALLALLFVGVSAGLWPRWRLTRRLSGAVFVLLPFILVGTHLTKSWAAQIALVVAMAAAGVVLVTLASGPTGVIERRDITRFVSAGTIVGACVLGVAILSGTRPGDLVDGAFLDPLQLPSVFAIPLHLPVAFGLEFLWWTACLATAFWYHRYLRRPSGDERVSGFLQLGAGLLILLCALAPGRWPAGLGVLNVTTSLPLLFFAATPGVGATGQQRIVRSAMVAMAVLGALVIYPVAGYQVSWAALLTVPVASMCVHDGLVRLRPLLSRAGGRRPWSTPGILVSLGLCAGALWLGAAFAGNLANAKTRYQTSQPMTLPGTEMIRLPHQQNRTLTSLSRAIRADCTSFVTGMNQLYFLTGEEPVTSFNTTDWMYLLSEGQQAQIVRRSYPFETRAQSHLCYVERQVSLSAVPLADGPPPKRPLLVFIAKFEREFTPPQVFGSDPSYALYVAPVLP